MQHLDDAAIAELLDDVQEGSTAGRQEHLAACAECRGRLDEARRVRDQARAILRSTDAGANPPPFAEVLARAGRTPRRRRVPWRGLAWAATVALAAGVGWYGRTLVLAPSPPTTPVPASAPMVAAAPSEAPADAEAADVPAPPPAQRIAPAEATPLAQASGAGGPGPTSSTERLAAPPIQPPQPAPGPVGRLDLRQAAPARAQAADVVQEAEATVDPWRTVSLDEARTLLGGDLQRVEGLQTLGYAVRAVRGGVEVRTEQRLASGDVLELLQRRAGDRTEGASAASRAMAQPVEDAADRDGPRRRATAAAVLTDSVRRGDFLITARAPISLDSLRALLLRLQ